MSYQLTQNPVPLWAVPERRPLQIDTDAIPEFLFLPNDFNSRIPNMYPFNDRSNSYSAGSSGIPHNLHLNVNTIERPYILKNVGRWSSVLLNQTDANDQFFSNIQDNSILDCYDLKGEWKSKLDDNLKPPNPSMFQRTKQNFIKNLAANPFYPLILRGSASAFLVIALSLCCSILVQTENAKKRSVRIPNTPYGPAATTIFGIVTCCISFVYMLISLWDETFGRPLGLRSTRIKLNFVTADLCLICLTSANLACAFDNIVSRKYICPGMFGSHICRLQKACTSFIFLALVVWFLSFLVSTFRMLDRASH